MSIERELNSILEEYTEKVDELTDDTMKKASRDAVKELKTTSAKMSGAYARDWAVKTEKGSIYDRFRNRLMFPVTTDLPIYWRTVTSSEISSALTEGLAETVISKMQSRTQSTKSSQHWRHSYDSRHTTINRSALCLFAL